MCDPAFQIRHNNGTQPLRRFAFVRNCVSGGEGGGGGGDEGGGHHCSVLATSLQV